MKKVMILGAGLLQSFVIKRAKELGYETIVLDMDKDAVGFKYADKYEIINIVDKELCLKSAIENKVDGVITAATDYGVITASYIAEKMGLNGLDLEVAQTIKNKYYVRKKLHEMKADDTTQFFELSNEKQIDEISNIVEFPLMIKPCDGSGSKGVCKVSTIQELKNAFNDAIKVSLSKKVLAETFIIGKEYGAESFVYNNQIYILGIMKKKMTEPPYYAELGHSVPSGLSDDIEKRVKEVVKKSIEALGINFGAVNMDLLITDDGKVCIVDIGARMGGNLIGSHIIPISTGIDYMGNIIKASVGDELNFQRTQNKVVATKLLNLQPGIVDGLPEYSKFEDEETEVICKLKQGDIINQYRNNLDGCGYVVVTSDSINKALEKSENIRKAIDNSIIRKND